MMKIERLTRIPDNDPWYLTPTHLDVAWESIYWCFPDMTRDTRWFPIDTTPPF